MDSKGSKENRSKENNLIYIYTIVEAQSVVDLVRLTNLKTKKGWKCLGGMCFISLPATEYPFCQSMYRMDKVEDKKVEKKFTAFPYEGGKTEALQVEVPQGNSPSVDYRKPVLKPVAKKTAFKKRFAANHPLKKNK